MLTVQYVGKGERTINNQVVYPGELIQTTPNLMAAWQAEHGDVFVVPGAEPVAGAEPAETEAPAGTDIAGQTPQRSRRK